MRICDLTTLYIDEGTGGVNTYLLEKARYLAGRPGVEHSIVVPGVRSETRDLFGSTLHTIESPPLPSNPPHRVLWRFAEVRRILREIRPDVVEVDCAYFLGRVASKALADRRVPIIGFYHVHLPTFIARPNASRFGGLASRVAEGLAWGYVRYCNRVCDRLIVSSRDIHDRLAAEGMRRLDHVPLGVNLDLFSGLHRGANGNGNGNGNGAAHPTTILYVGRLSREKSVPVLLEAFKLLAPRGDFRLEIVGDGAQRAALEQLAAGDPRIRFHGECPYGPELAQLYASADVFALPSPNETFSLATLEALASGIPVVAMSQGGPVNLVPPGLGALAVPGDAADLAEKLFTVSRSRIAAARCREYIERNYSWDRTFDRILEIYERAIASRAPALAG